MPNIPVNDMTCVLYEYNLLKASQKWHVRMPQKFYSQSLLCILIMCIYGSSRNSEWTLPLYVRIIYRQQAQQAFRVTSNRYSTCTTSVVIMFVLIVTVQTGCRRSVE